MTPIEKSKLIDELFSLRKADQELMESEHKRMETERKLMEPDRNRLDDLLDSFQAVNVELRALRIQIAELLNMYPIAERFIRPLAGERNNSLFFAATVSGRRDYEKLLPITIGIKPNKI